MEYQKTKRDIDQENIDNKSNPVVIYLRNKDNWQFNVGDILIRQWQDSDGNLRTEEVGSGVPKKYLYAFENSVGVGYIKGFNADGRMSEVPVCITEYISDHAMFVLDPDYADHLMIGEGKYDPLVLQREKRNYRNRMLSKNRKLLIAAKTPAELLAWFKTLKIGDTLYYGYNISDMTTNKYEVIDIKTNSTVNNVNPSYRRENIKKRSASTIRTSILS